MSLYNVFFILIGFALGVVFSYIKDMKTFREKFGRPSDGSIELNWFGRQFFCMFSENAKERWYDARVHVRSGFWVSLLCAFGVLYAVRFDFELANDYGRGTTRIKHYHGFRDFDKLKQAILSDVSDVRKTIEEECYFSGALISGHNFVSAY